MAMVGTHLTFQNRVTGIEVCSEKPLAEARGFFHWVCLILIVSAFPNYFGCCCWSWVVPGAELLESCSKSFFIRLTSTRPPLIPFA